MSKTRRWQSILKSLPRPLVCLLATCLLMNSILWAQEDAPGATDQATATSPGSEVQAETASDRAKLAEESPLSTDAAQAATRKVGRQDLIASLTIFVLAVFVGFEVITKVPPTLHTPLMSGSNAISGITLVGALIVASATLGWFSPFLGFIAVVLATVNAVGGFLVTHRMLSMFKRR